MGINMGNIKTGSKFKEGGKEYTLYGEAELHKLNEAAYQYGENRKRKREG